MSGVISVIPRSDDVEALAVLLGIEAGREALGQHAAPLSITQRRSRTCRLITTSGRITESSIVQKLCTRTLENSSERRTVEPLMMQPPDTIESTAMPRRPSSSNTNFAGGSCSW